MSYNIAVMKLRALHITQKHNYTLSFSVTGLKYGLLSPAMVGKTAAPLAFCSLAL